MSALQPFLISEFKSGINTYLKPWVRPMDAFEPLLNAYVYRGIVKKRNGSTIFGNQLADTKPVMGIMQYINESTAASTLVVASTKNLYSFAPGSAPDAGTFTLLTTIGGAASVFWQGAVTGATTDIPSSGTIPTFWQNLTPSSVTITAYNGSSSVGTVTDNGSGKWLASSATGIFPAGGGDFGSINYTTGVVAFPGVTIGSSYTLSLNIAATTTGNYFTGTIKNFFASTNWQPTTSVNTLGSSYLYMVNNNDPVTLFDGTNLSRPIFYVSSSLSNYIVTALDVKVYSNRLLLIRPTISSESNADNQAIYYSALFSPLNFIANVPGNGGFLAAATSDIIQTAEFLRDNLIVAFTNSHWTFQITGLVSPPFIFRKLNISKNISCPYGSVNYDERVTNLGATGFVGCDGVNVQRYDVPVIDYYETQINQSYFSQDYAIRYDAINQSWMFYPSTGADATLFPKVGGIAPGSDQTLIYNFLENTWATFDNSFPMTCLGFYNVSFGTRWEDLTIPWDQVNAPWFSYGTQLAQPILLAGDTSGNIYHMDNPLAVRDGETFGTPGSGTSFDVNITTTRWNPFMKLGQKTQFAYIDIYYSIESTNPANPIDVTLSFYVDNSNNAAARRTLTLDGPVNSGYTFKRVYCNLIGEFIQMNIDPSEDASIEFLGFILWCKPAGRLTPL